MLQRHYPTNFKTISNAAKTLGGVRMLALLRIQKLPNPNFGFLELALFRLFLELQAGLAFSSYVVCTKFSFRCFSNADY